MINNRKSKNLEYNFISARNLEQTNSFSKKKKDLQLPESQL